MPENDGTDPTQDPTKTSKSEDATDGVVEDVTGSFSLPEDDE